MGKVAEVGRIKIIDGLASSAWLGKTTTELSQDTYDRGK